MKKIFLLALVVVACNPAKEYRSVGTIERLDPRLDEIIDKDAKIEVIAEGYNWSEGPVWIESQKMLLFSDVPENIVYKWTEEKGAEQYLTPSGFTGTTTDSQEKGSNGLLLDDQGRLVLCQHGDRRLAFMNADVANPSSTFTTIVDNYMGKRFNSPNDAVRSKSSGYFMTDPPYGLGTKDEKDPSKEIPFQGVYKIGVDGAARLLVDTLTRPNGIALSPDEKFLFVANSDPNKSRWYKFELGDTSIVSGSVFYDATQHGPEDVGLPDGLKIDDKGNLFASGPGGVWIFSPMGEVLGKIKLATPTSNTGFSSDGKTLFITNDDLVLRVKLRK